MQSNEDMRKSTYNSAKIILTLLVVIAHSTRMYTGYGAFTPVRSSYVLSVLSALIYAFHMPAFVMLSGCVYGYQIDNLGKYTKPVPFVKRKAQRLLIPYICFGMLYVTPIIYALQLTNLSIGQYFLKGIVLALDCKHLWYILALFWIYCFALLLRKVLLLNKKYVEIIVVICSFLLSMSAKYLPDILQLSAAAEYWLYFVLGIYLNRHVTQFSRPEIRYVNWIGIPLCAAVLLFRIFLLNTCLSYIYALSGCFLVFILSQSMNDDLSKKLPAQCILNNSYGIYLFHPMIIYLLYSVTWKANIAPILLASSVALISFGVSLSLTGIIRKTRLCFVIGEHI